MGEDADERATTTGPTAQSSAPPTPSDVTCVVPVYNGQRTLAACLASIRQHAPGLAACIVIDDGSTDRSREIAAAADCCVVTQPNAGAAAARNRGLREATTDWVWFVDADCTVFPDTLDRLLPHASDGVAGVGGSYENRNRDSVLATAIHEEIVARHRRMGRDVDHLATYNVLYRRRLLLAAGGFDEAFRQAEDVELCYRLVAGGHPLRFEPQSLVTHDHPTRLFPYLRKQFEQAYYRMRLYRVHPRHVSGDSYVNRLDIVRPLAAAAAAFAFSAGAIDSLLRPAASHFLGVALGLAAVVVGCSIPMAREITRQTDCRTGFASLGLFTLRAFARAAGLVCGVFRFVVLPQRTDSAPDGTLPTATGERR